MTSVTLTSILAEAVLKVCHSDAETPWIQEVAAQEGELACLGERGYSKSEKGALSFHLEASK